MIATNVLHRARAAAASRPCQRGDVRRRIVCTGDWNHVSHHRRRSNIARRIMRICCDATASAAPLQVPATAAIAVVAASFPNFRVSGIRLRDSLWIREVPKIETFFSFQDSEITEHRLQRTVMIQF